MIDIEFLFLIFLLQFIQKTVLYFILQMWENVFMIIRYEEVDQRVILIEIVRFFSIESYQFTPSAAT